MDISDTCIWLFFFSWDEPVQDFSVCRWSPEHCWHPDPASPPLSRCPVPGPLLWLWPLWGGVCGRWLWRLGLCDPEFCCVTGHSALLQRPVLVPLSLWPPSGMWCPCDKVWSLLHSALSDKKMSCFQSRKTFTWPTGKNLLTKIEP